MMERPDVERIEREAKSLHHRNFPGGVKEAYQLEDRLFDEDIPALLAYITALEAERDRANTERDRIDTLLSQEISKRGQVEAERDEARREIVDTADRWEVLYKELLAERDRLRDVVDAAKEAFSDGDEFRNYIVYPNDGEKLRAALAALGEGES